MHARNGTAACGRWRTNSGAIQERITFDKASMLFEARQ